MRNRQELGELEEGREEKIEERNCKEIRQEVDSTGM